MTVALGVWAYLALTGFLSPWLACAYALIVAAALCHFGSAHLAWAVQAVPYGAMIWTAWRRKMWRWWSQCLCSRLRIPPRNSGTVCCGKRGQVAITTNAIQATSNSP